MLDAVDISQWQGPYQDYGTPIVFMKVSGGDDGLYFDSQAANNYNQARAQGKGVGMYHFAGAHDPIVEADFFIRACSPLAENDVMALDWEVQHPDPVAWCLAFVTRVHDQTGVWPLLYINLSTLRAYDWSPVLANCGLWIAAWTGDPNVNVNTGGHPYVVHQWQGSPLDRDAVWLTMEQFNAYGFHANQPTPSPEPTTTTTEAPTPDPTTTTTTADVPAQPDPTTTTTTTEEPQPVPSTTTTTAAPATPGDPIKQNWVTAVINWFIAIINYLRGKKQ